MANRQNKVIFPENLKISAKLEPSDRAEIARRSGYSPAYITDIISGRRRMNDKVKRAIVELMRERQELDRAIDEITNQN